jgi:HTH-type transcriptional regulator/antitoxin HipB
LQFARIHAHIVLGKDVRMTTTIHTPRDLGAAIRDRRMTTTIHTPRDLGAAIRDRRKALDLDQTELARRAGVSRRWLVDAESGKPGAALILVLQTLRALGMEMLLSPEGATHEVEPIETPDLDQVIARARRTPPTP